ncbi:hypothetical protein OG689_24775 [Kitasatospora sp. NBC_00240]|uniref:hypothetical protein n=1 Tax=Kitasatospora sp. NBC_00240 TaxID=2903567 RepID=UPI002251E8A2|nr:hypothetical protein [Kitasatospora sp. NBC_00240]MCX5212459.1 hypothetical protein [Kitasatospora sp. NBC_00240]
MRASGISAFTKNVPSLSRRGKMAGLAATVLLAGAVQLLPADSAWACGDSMPGPSVSAPVPTATHQGSVEAGLFMTPGPLKVTAGGAPLEIPVEVGNFTGAPYEKVVPLFALSNPSGGLDPKYVVLEANLPGKGWQKLPLHFGCDPTLWTDASAFPGEHLDDGHATHFTFRLSFTADAYQDLREVEIGLFAEAEVGGVGKGQNHLVTVLAPAGPTSAPTAAPSKTATPAPTTASPAKAPSKAPSPATSEPAVPVAVATTAAPTTAPATATPTTATTAPAPAELAHTGGSRSTGPLIGAGGALVLLGAGGVLIARRRARG